MKTPTSLSWVQKSIYSALVFFGTLVILTLAYAATTYYTDLPTTSSGSGLTATSWNNLVNYANKAVKQDTEVLTVTGGRVGIGTTGPDSKLSILAPDTTVSPTLSFRQANASTYGFDIAVEQVLYARLDIETVLNNVRAPALSIMRSNGNIGIGTTNPGAKLEVVGNMVVSGNFSNLLSRVNSACLAKATSGYYAYLISRDASSNCSVACGETTGGSCLSSYYNPGDGTTRSLPYICTETVASYSLCCCSAGSWPSSFGAHTLY